MALQDFVNRKIKTAINGIDKTEQLQSIINTELNFRRNSINLYIGRRGSGKTFNVLRELIELSNLPDKDGYNSFIYCTDKSNDCTVKELLGIVKLNVRVVKYNDMPLFLTNLIKSKNAYQQVIDEGLTENVTDECRTTLLKALDISDFYEYLDADGQPITPSTAILYDDAINIFKSNKFKGLLDLLQQNRQPKITYFLCMQDGFPLPPQIKRDLDTCIIFGGYTDSQMLMALLRQLNSSTTSNQMVMAIYRNLSNREGLLFDYLPNKTVLRILNE
jgi:hypothetical protein